MNDLRDLLINLLPIKIEQCKNSAKVAEYLKDTELEQQAIGQMQAYQVILELVMRWKSE